MVISGVLVHSGWLEVAGSGQGRSASVGKEWFVDVFVKFFVFVLLMMISGRLVGTGGHSSSKKEYNT